MRCICCNNILIDKERGCNKVILDLDSDEVFTQHEDFCFKCKNKSREVYKITEKDYTFGELQEGCVNSFGFSDDYLD